MVKPAKEFIGTERFSLLNCLGSGGMGVVYEALDRKMDRVVALKTLTRAEAAHIYRFKREFRSLADVSHPNLISLYELMSDGQDWFFTMELIKGVTFIEYVRPESAGLPPTSADNTLPSPRTIEHRTHDSDADTEIFEYARDSLETGNMMAALDDQSPFLESNYQLDVPRLRAALRQLAEGVHALHEMGKLHRDIKPSNVLVTDEGRVVLLDFGLVEDINPELHETLLAGTPDYMSPEQGAQTRISKASDWYSVGVILYQALTGRLPFRGKFFEIMMRKQTREPIQAREINPDIPRDLNDLCTRLLRRKPETRPSGREILRALGVRSATQIPLTSGSTAEASFVGREKQLAELHDAFRATREGQTVTVYVHGNSGMGKSTLVRTFLDQVKESTRKAVVLQGRCYERESVPYKGLDGVVDSLSKHLASQRRTKVESLMPRNRAALARVFPVMLQVDAIFDARSKQPETIDLFTMRRQAFGALRELLSRLAQQKPLIIYIDDLQWADADSTFLLEDLLQPPDAPPLLLIASFRSEDIDDEPFLKQMLSRTGTEQCRELELGPLDIGEAREMTRSLFATAGFSGESFIDSVVHEAAGSPFLLEQLTHYGMMNERAATAGISLPTMLEERIRQLPPGSRALLNVLAVARRPVNEEVALGAAGIKGDPLQLLTTLRTSQFVRSGGTGYGVEVYHDRIGETLASLLDDNERRQIHRRLAQAIEARGLDDPESLYEDYLGAGETDRAVIHASTAAQKAASALAFDRAALFYRRAIDLKPDAANVVDLQIGMGDALANAGRPAEAAAEFLEAAKATSAQRALELRQRAGAQLLMGGHIEEGLAVFRVVLEAVGLKLAKGPKRALLSVAWRRLWIHFRGLDFVERDAADIPETDLQRIDICWAVAAGLGVVDLIRGADFQSLHLLLALRAGEISRLTRAMAFEVSQTAARGGAAQDRVAELLEKTEDLAKRAGNARATGMAIWARGLSSYLLGRWKEAAEYCERGAEILRDQCTGMTWEITIANRFMLTSLLYLGEVVEVSRRVPQLISAALEQGNLFAATDLRTRLNAIWLAADDPDRARDEVIAAMTSWPRKGFHLQHYTSLVALAQIELYTGDSEVAWKHIDGQLKPLEKSMLLRIQGLRIDAMQLRGRVAIASAFGKHRETRLRIAETVARRIEHENMPYANPYAKLIQAGIARLRGNDASAIALLENALKEFEAADMRLYAVSARRRLGEMIGGDRGQELLQSADEWMDRQQIKNPARMVNLIAPGF